jgi:hypothetical protein
MRFVMAALVVASLPAATSAQTAELDRRYEETRRTTADLIALMDAASNKTTFCSAYVGKTVAPSTFTALRTKLAAPSAKGEYETTAQFQARNKGVGASRAGPFLLSVPIDRDYVRYDADTKGMTVSAGAFRAGEFSEAVQAEIAGGMAVIASKVDDSTPRIELGVGGSERVLGTRAGRNIVGTTIRITDMERHTQGLSLRGERLFAAGKDASSPVMIFDVPLAQAAKLKPALKAAIIIMPEEPYTFEKTRNGAAATAQKPTHYVEHTSLIFAAPRCGLIMDGQMKVLASADAGQSQ